MDIVRVLRVIEYVGPRNKVEPQVRDSIHGEKTYRGVTIRAVTVTPFPEYITVDPEPNIEEENSR
jgi:hypothetical protein